MEQHCNQILHTTKESLSLSLKLSLSLSLSLSLKLSLSLSSSLKLVCVPPPPTAHQVCFPYLESRLRIAKAFFRGLKDESHDDGGAQSRLEEGGDRSWTAAVALDGDDDVGDDGDLGGWTD